MKYKTLGTSLDRDFRNDLNKNFGDIDNDIQAVQSDVNSKNNSTNTRITQVEQDINSTIATKESESVERDNHLEDLIVTKENESLQRDDDLDTRIDTIVAQAGNDNTEIVDARGNAPVLGQRLNDFDAQLAQTETQINGLDVNKMDKNTTDIAVSQINKNKGKLDETYMTDEFLQQMAGTTSVHSVPADGSITLRKTAFYKTGKNLFNKNVVTNDYYVSGTTGNLVADELFTVSEYIVIEPSTAYIKKTGHSYAFYDADKVFISGASSGTAFTTPSNAIFIRISTTKTSLDTQQLEKGTVSTSYEPYVELIKKDFLETPNVDANNLNFGVESSNLFNKNDAKLNTYISSSSGNETSGTDFVASAFIPIQSNAKYIGLEVWHWAFYDSNKVFISGGTTGTTKTNIVIESPSNAAFLRFSWYTVSRNITVDVQQMNKGDKLLPYNAFGKIIPKAYVEPKKIPLALSDSECPVSKIYGVAGKEMNIYLDALVWDDYKKYLWVFDSPQGIGRYQNERWTFTPSSSMTTSLNIKKYNAETLDLIKEKNIDVSISGTTSFDGVNKKVLVIGDSTVAGMVNRGEISNLFLNDVANITLIGTKGTSPDKHEGIPGWDTAKFLSSDSPFVFDGQFDFGQYLSSNTLDSPDYVLIMLGINDMFGNGLTGITDRINNSIANIETMVNNIHTFNANIKVGVCLPINPSFNQDAFASSYGLSPRWQHKRKMYLFNNGLINTFQNKTNTYLVPVNVNLDTERNMPKVQVEANSRNNTLIERQSDGVHPDDNGYKQMSDSYYYFLKNV